MFLNVPQFYLYVANIVKFINLLTKNIFIFSKREIYRLNRFLFFLIIASDMALTRRHCHRCLRSIIDAGL